MGVGLNSTQQITGAVTAAALAAAKIKDGADKEAEKAEQDLSQGLLAKEQFHEAKAEMTQLTGESKEAEKALQEKTAISDALELKKPGGKGNTKEALNQKRAAALSEKEAAERAFSALGDRIEAKRAMMARATSIMKRTGVKE